MVDSEGRLMSEINRIAAKFLLEHLERNPETCLHQVSCPVRRYEVVDSHETAVEFLQQLQSGNVKSQRMNITDTAPVVIRRVCLRYMPAYLAGTRRDGKLIWTHHPHLASTFNPDEAAKVAKYLEDQNIPNSILLVPESRHGSL